ncbi:hypothetical protein L6164_012391 [Bauhinia variegata]|uniref:Uncharacterized protein n=1 Tax=Bauhinia variegata TaxID=167791 RepID=A0ACB9P8Y6_BAUVA|nr:hypothetical protein L6164_012391 [Bauhinia variegata]
MSIEALAMAGADYMDFPVDAGSSERSSKLVPHLLADAYAEQDLSACSYKVLNSSLRLELHDKWLKTKIREWAKAASLNNKRKANLKAKEITLIMDCHKSQANDALFVLMQS